MKTHRLRPAVRTELGKIPKDKAMTQINQALVDLNKEVFNF